MQKSFIHVNSFRLIIDKLQVLVYMIVHVMIVLSVDVHTVQLIKQLFYDQ